MKTAWIAVVVLLSGFLLTAEATAFQDFIVKRDAAETFIKLPRGVRFPEGITANPWNGKLYVGTFDGEGNNKLLRFDRDGDLQATKDFGETPLLGLEFNPGDHKVYICNFGLSAIQRIAANFTGGTAVETVAVIPQLGAPPDRIVANPDGSTDRIVFGSNRFPAPNALVLSKDGDLFISDSFQGAIFKIENVATCPTPCPVATVIHDGLLATAGFPPFGANGLALNYSESKLFIANTGDDRVLKLDLGTKELTVFAESINGADGLASDYEGRLWVAANQADEIVGLNKDGRVIAKLGDFKGITRNGTPRGLLFPASLVIVGYDIFVTNLALPLTPTLGDEPEEDVRRWTISRIHLPGAHDRDHHDDD